LKGESSGLVLGVVEDDGFAVEIVMMAYSDSRVASRA
jgi:hypothetical protein